MNVTDLVRERMLDTASGACAYCGQPLERPQCAICGEYLPEWGAPCRYARYADHEV